MYAKNFVVIVLSFFFLGCTSNISKEELYKLNGYWEIGQVVFPDGNTKQYKMNTSIDYIQLENLQGYRKKVQPKLNGTYETSDDAEVFLITEIGGSFYVNYKTELSEWSEKLVELDTDSFSVINQEGVRYEYKRFEPISITE